VLVNKMFVCLLESLVKSLLFLEQLIEIINKKIKLKILKSFKAIIFNLTSEV